MAKWRTGEEERSQNYVVLCLLLGLGKLCLLGQSIPKLYIEQVLCLPAPSTITFCSLFLNWCGFNANVFIQKTEM